MPRTKGAKNIVPFEGRASIDSTSTATILHLATQATDTPLEQFRALLRHETNFLKWIDSRHDELLKAKADATGVRGPKDATYRKYKWYAEQNSLLEAINAFETFFKETFTRLGAAIHRYVPSGSIKGTVEARTVWSSGRSAEPAALVFGAQLFHNLATIDEVTNMLVAAKRYKPQSNPPPRASKARALQAIFQIRHTLSHNQGRITEGDSSKFEMLGFAAPVGEVIDPTKDHLGRVVRQMLLDEANDFTKWLLAATIDFLQARANSGIKLRQADQLHLEAVLGQDAAIAALPWS